MVLIDERSIANKLSLLQNGRRMPLLCSLDRSLGKRILSENNEDQTKALRSDYFDIAKEMETNENYLTSIASSQGVLAIGSALTQGHLYFIKDASAVKDVPDVQRFKPIHKEVLETPIYSLDWSDNHLAIGTKSGIAKLFKVQIKDDMMEQFVPVGQYVDSSLQQMIAPSYTVNSHVKSVEFAPHYHSDCIDSNKGNETMETASVPNRFLSLAWNHLSIWDASQETAPISRMLPSDAPLNSASWSLHDPLVVCGGQDKGLVIVDTRIGQSVWRSKNAHDRAITDAKFNPFIPYWVASAGEDSVVNIWDIRASYHLPVAKVDGHSSTVTSVAWSNIRPENLSTTSMDGTMKFWTLTSQDFPVWDTLYKVSRFNIDDTIPIVQDRTVIIQQQKQAKQNHLQSWMSDENNPEEEESKKTVLLGGAIGLGSWGKKQSGSFYKGELNFESRGSVMSVMASKTRPSLYYCITSGGQLTSQIVRYDTKTNLQVRHRFDPIDKDPLCIEIEDAIYCRRINEAKIKLELYKKNLLDQGGDDETVKKLQSYLELKPPIGNNEWDFNSLDIEWEETIDHFKNDLEFWGHRIPPGFDEYYKFPLEISGPILASLIEEEENPTPIPSTPLTENKSSYFDDSDLQFEVNQQLPDNDSLPTQASTSLEDRSYVENEASSISIKSRRNIQHIPPIVTVNENNNTSPSNNNPFTPPYSAPIVTEDATLQPATVQNKNPFEKPQTDIPTPKYTHSFDPAQSTNPFETTPSTNPFETNSLVVPNDDDDDRKSVNSTGSSKSRHRSWLSLSLRRTKQVTDDDQKVPMSAKSLKTRRHFF